MHSEWKGEGKVCIVTQSRTHIISERRITAVLGKVDTPQLYKG